MDGAFIAYHNTQEIFGFEYIKLKEMERRIFGNDYYANASFMVKINKFLNFSKFCRIFQFSNFK